MNQASQDRGRIAYMDLARSVLLVSGMILHISLLHTPQGLVLKSAMQSDVLAWVLEFVRSFRMPSLFLVSGFFSALLVDRKGLQGFLRNRMVRMGVPFLVCGLLVNSLMVKLALSPPMSLDSMHFLDGSWQFHLWNIGNLIAYELCVYAALRFWPRLHELASKPIAWWAWILGTVVASMVLIRIWRYAPEFVGLRWLVHPQQFFEYGGYYLAGYFLHQSKGLMASVTRPAVAIPFVVGVEIVRAVLPPMERGFLADRLDETMVVLHHLAATLVLFAMLRWLGGKGDWIRRLSLASYTIYLLHMPILLVAFPHIDALGWGWWGILSMFLVSFLAPLAFHLWVVEKWSWAGWIFNGKDYADRSSST